MGVAASPSSSSETLDADLWNSIADLKAVRADDVKFFDRQDELIQLVDILSMDPLRIILLVGPTDAGKSALLSHLQALWTSESSIRKVFSPFLLINMRKKECTSPPELAKAITSEIISWHRIANAELNELKAAAGSISGAPVGHLIKVLGDFFNSVSGSSLGAIQDGIRLYVEMYGNLRPVIVIDEANMLGTWEGKHDTELASLMQFFLWMTKETSKGHVVMASSDNFFFSWIRKKLLSTRMLVLGLGHFSHENAKSFVSDHLLQDHDDKQLKDGFEQAWSSIYAVAGGSPQCLKDIVFDARRFRSWALAVQNMLEAAELEVEDGMLDDKDALKIMKLIVSNGGAVGMGFVKDAAFNGNATLTKAVVERLVRDNVVHVRIWLAGMKFQDLNIAKGDDKEYLMAISPASFAAMRSLLQGIVSFP